MSHKNKKETGGINTFLNFLKRDRFKKIKQKNRIITEKQKNQENQKKIKTEFFEEVFIC
ncbi:hypothetical protein [Methanimicrococcus hacksteinii]|uniref:hypothetical protein n=1 Tax=Methanimicrococcus hacksteinii TaxID=3028293 RepID=UPI00298F0DD2|nr:hypothetical protein [Methanimicrococcus sp. At1]